MHQQSPAKPFHKKQFSLYEVRLHYIHVKIQMAIYLKKYNILFDSMFQLQKSKKGENKLISLIEAIKTLNRKPGAGTHTGTQIHKQWRGYYWISKKRQ